MRVVVASLLANRLRLILTAVTIAISAALVAGTFILTDAVRGALSISATAASAAAVYVQPSGVTGGKTTGGPSSLPASLAVRIRAIPGVASAQGLVNASKVSLFGKDGRPITHHRAPNELISYPAAAALAAQYTLQSGRPPRQPGQALLDAATARSLGYHIGDKIAVVTPTGLRTLTVTGITGFDGADSPPAAQVASFDTPTVVVVSPATAQQLTGLAGRFTEIDVLARAGVSADELRSRMARLMPPGAQVVTGQQAAMQQAASAAGYLDNLQQDLLAFCTAALLVAAFVIASTFSILAAQRTREYALLRVVGASRGQLLRSCLAEAGILGLTASAVGTGLGALAAAGLRGLIGLLGGTVPVGDVVIAPRTVVIALATGTAVTVGSALRSARSAARVLPIQALREAAPPSAKITRGRRVVAITALAAATALIVTGAFTQDSVNTALTGIGAIAAFTAAVSAGPLLAAAVAGLIVAAAARVRGPRKHRIYVPVLLAGDNAARDPRKTATLAAILTAGLATATTVSIVAASAQASAQDAIRTTSHASLYLQGSIGPDLARAIARRPGVAATMRIDDPLVQVAGTPARVAGVDPATAPALVDFGVRTGSLTRLSGNGLFVSVLQAVRHRWHIGSAVAVDFGHGGPRPLHIVGTFADKRFLGDDYLMPIQSLFIDMPDQLGEANVMLIRAAARTTPTALLTSLAPVLTSHPELTELTPAQYRSSRAADLGDISHVLGLLTALVTLTEAIAALGIASALSLSVSERTRELAILRALGLTRHQLAAMIRAESVITCLLGALPGAAIGCAAGTAIAATITRDQTGVATVGLSPAQLAAALVLTCFVGLLAAIPPARRAARTHPPRAISEQA